MSTAGERRDEVDVTRIKDFLHVLEAAVTAALPLIVVASSVQDRMKRLSEMTNGMEDASARDAFLREYREIGTSAPEIERANTAFRHALDVLDLDLASDYGMSVSIAATMISAFVVKNAHLSGRSPEEVWQEYILRESDIDWFI